MRKTALAVTALATLLAAPLLTACGSDPHPGAAAVVGDERITVSELQTQVKQVRDAQLESPQSKELLAKTPQLTRDTLKVMLVRKVIERAAQDSGAGEPSEREIQEARTGLEKQVGGPEALAEAALQGGVAPEQLDEVAKQEAQRLLLISYLGNDEQAVNEALMTAARELDVDVNPRFGTWDPAKGSLENVKLPWLRQVTKSEQPA